MSRRWSKECGSWCDVIPGMLGQSRRLQVNSSASEFMTRPSVQVRDALENATKSLSTSFRSRTIIIVRWSFRFASLQKQKQRFSSILGAWIVGNCKLLGVGLENMTAKRFVFNVHFDCKGKASREQAETQRDERIVCLKQLFKTRARFSVVARDHFSDAITGPWCLLEWRSRQWQRQLGLLDCGRSVVGWLLEPMGWKDWCSSFPATRWRRSLQHNRRHWHWDRSLLNHGDIDWNLGVVAWQQARSLFSTIDLTVVSSNSLVRAIGTAQANPCCWLTPTELTQRLVSLG